MKRYEELEDLDTRRTPAPKRQSGSRTVCTALILSLLLMAGNLSLYRGASPGILIAVWAAVFGIFYAFLRLLQRRP